MYVDTCYLNAWLTPPFTRVCEIMLVMLTRDCGTKCVQCVTAV